jgi:xanthine dehydrogenase accessory factor
VTERLTHALRRALDKGEAAVLVTVAGARGSTPREAGAAMLVMRDAMTGTIGGGTLEWTAVARARQMLAGGETRADMDVPLGPEIGQCCGGRVRLSLALADAATLAALAEREAAEADDAPSVLVFGAGHVGHALAAALAPLPFRTTLVDPRAEMLADLPEDVATKCSALPEAEVRAAPAGSAFVVLTHSHALDFTIAEAALVRQDAAYVGMIGSKTKRAQFSRWFREQGYDAALLGCLVLPIGGSAVRDKRPAVIAALVAAEVTTRLLGAAQAAAEAPGREQAQSGVGGRTVRDGTRPERAAKA